MHKTKTLLVIILALALLKQGTAQNLVPNPSFENVNFVPCSWCVGPEFNDAMITWQQASTGSADIFSTTNNIDCWSHMPFNSYQYQSELKGSQTPRTGDNFVGIRTYLSTNNYREYVTIALNGPLLPNTTNPYLVRFYISLGDNAKCASDIGLLFSKEDVTISDGTLLEYQAQFVTEQPIIDTSNWAELTWCYFPEDTMNHITIGNFFDYTETNTIVFNPSYPKAYYFIDDVYVGAVDVWISGDSTICQGDTATLYANGNDTVSWALSSNTSEFFSTDTVVNVNPTESTTYWLYGPRDTVPFRVHVDPSSLFLGDDTTICYGDTLTLNANYSGFSNLWSDYSNDTSFAITDAGSYWLEISNNACIRKDSIKVNLSHPVVNLGNDTSIYSNQTLLLDAGAGFENYLWNDLSILSSLLVDGTSLSPDDYLYWVDVNNDLGCEASDSITVTVLLGTGISEILEQQVQIYPNPTKGKILVDIPNSNPDSYRDTKYSIISVDGLTLKQGTKTSAPFELNFQDKGIYYFKLEMNEQTVVKRIVVY